MSTATESKVGKITQIIGSTFDAQFPDDALPAIYNAVKIESDQKGVKLDLTGEVQQHLGGGRVRCIALGSTDGMIRGQDCVDTGSSVSVQRDEGSDRERWRSDQAAFDDVQPSSTVADYWRDHGDHRRRRGTQQLTNT